jgi:hypothetical protein
MKKHTLYLSVLMSIANFGDRLFSQDINFSSEYNRITWPVALGINGGITGDDGNYKRIAVYHGGSISLQTGTNTPNINNSRLYIDANGNVGIGTNTPGARFAVASPGYTGTPVNTSLAFISQSTNPSGTDLLPALELSNGGSGGYGLVSLATNNYFSGNVGIGTTSPDAMLAVSGQVHAQEVKVSATVPGPDYVFEKDYKLSSLDSIKNYIEQNKHLPEVPSAKEMEKDGIQLGEMNMLLLKKIEELTLYMLEQDKKIHEQSKKMEEQDEKMKEQEARIKSLEGATKK